MEALISKSDSSLGILEVILRLLSDWNAGGLYTENREGCCVLALDFSLLPREDDEDGESVTTVVGLDDASMRAIRRRRSSALMVC